MRDRAVANLFRLARVRSDLRQIDVAVKSRLSRASIGHHEVGRLEGATLRSLRRHAEAMGLTLELQLRGPAGHHVTDEEHALLTQWVKGQLEGIGWQTEAEASYSIFGERGRIDLLAWHSERRIVLLTEQKTEIVDIQELLGTLGVKERLVRTIARDRGWEPSAVAVLVVFTRTSRNLHGVRRFARLFDRFSLRGAAAVRWLRNPRGDVRMLLLVPPSAIGRPAWRTGRRRVTARLPLGREPSSATTQRFGPGAQG